MSIPVERCIVSRDLTEPQTESRRQMHRVRDGGGRVGCVDDRHAGRLTRSSTHGLPGAATRARPRRWVLVLVGRRLGGDLRRRRRQPLAATGADWARASPDRPRAEAHCRSSRRCRRWKPDRVRGRRVGAVVGSWRRWLGRTPRRRLGRLRVRPVPVTRRQRALPGTRGTHRTCRGTRRGSSGSRSTARRRDRHAASRSGAAGPVHA